MKKNTITQFNVGTMGKETGELLFKAVNGKTFMDFQVKLGTCPEGYDVVIETQYKESKKRITSFLIALLATNATK